MSNSIDSLDEKAINWRNMGVRRERRFEPLMKILTTGEKVIFKHLKDIMVFAAMVGFSNNNRKALKAGDTIPITLGTYESDNQDCFIYLLSIMTLKDGNCLRDENLQESIKIFEEYCNAGLETINDWIEDNDNKKPAVDVLLDKIYGKLCDNKSKDGFIDNSELELPPL